MNNQRILVIVGVLIAVAAAGAGAGSYLALQDRQGKEPPPGVMWPNPKTFPDVTLYDHAGGEFRAADLRGQWSLIFFGFTHCPDICPDTLAVLDRVERRLGEGEIPESELRTVFISVDPRRDTPERLAEYVGYFNDDFIGVSGKPEAIDRLTRSLGAVYQIGDPDEHGDYTVDHSASVFLFDPKGRLISVFTTPHEAAEISNRFRAVRDFIRRQSS